MPVLFSQMFQRKPKSPEAEIVNISFYELKAAALTASNRENADSIKRLLQLYINTSGTDGTPLLELTIKKSKTDINIEITGEGVLTALKRLLKKVPCPFSKECVEKIKAKSEGAASLSGGASDSESAPLLEKRS